jgi:3-mercaptopyruvate sulfurtransferase SseA
MKAHALLQVWVRRIVDKALVYFGSWTEWCTSYP